MLQGDVEPRVGTGTEVEGTMVRGLLGADKDKTDLLGVLDKLGIVVWFTDTKGVVDECNKTACELVEREKEEVLGVVLAEGKLV